MLDYFANQVQRENLMSQVVIYITLTTLYFNQCLSKVSFISYFLEQITFLQICRQNIKCHLLLRTMSSRCFTLREGTNDRLHMSVQQYVSITFNSLFSQFLHTHKKGKEREKKKTEEKKNIVQISEHLGLIYTVPVIFPRIQRQHDAVNIQ